MCPATARTLLALLLPLLTLASAATALRPHRPANVKLEAVEGGLRVTWDSPEEADVRPVNHYIIGYGTSMRTLRFTKVDKHQRSLMLTDVVPGILHFLKMIAENDEGRSKPIYKAETPRDSPKARPPVGGAYARQRSSAQRSALLEHNRGYLLNLEQSDRKVDDKPRLEAQRGHTTGQLASESVYVVSLQAQNALQPSTFAYRAALTKNRPADPEELYEAKEITVRVVSPQSVMVTWVDPAVEKEKSSGDSRHYTLRYREKGESARWDYKETPQKRLLIDSLTADNMYEFSIRISQGERHGRWSSSVFQRTPESAPTSPPENFHVQPLRGKGTAVTATWDPPDEANGKIREYVLTYAPALQPFGAKSITYQGSTTSAVIDGLQPGNSYIFKIRAANRRGQGPSTKPFSVAMPTSNTVSSTSEKSKSQEDLKSRHSSTNPSKINLSKDTKDSDLQSTEETDEPAPYFLTTPSPTARRSRPLSHSRSYHSVISSARSPVRRRPSVSLETTDSRVQDKDKQTSNDKEIFHKEPSKVSESSDDSEEDLEGKDIKSKNHSVTQNQALAQEQLKHNSKHTNTAGVSNPSVKSDSSPQSPVKSKKPFLHKTPPYRRVTPVLISHNPSGAESSSPRTTPPTTNRKSVHHPLSHEHKKMDGNTFPALSGKHDSAVIKKDFTVRSDGKESYNLDAKIKPSAAPIQETTSKSYPNPSVRSPGRERASDLTNIYAGVGYVNSRRKPGGPVRGTPRVVHGQRKPVSSSVGLQPNFPTAQNPLGSSQPVDTFDTTKLKENDPVHTSKEEVSKDERPTSTSPILHSSSSALSKSYAEKDIRTQEHTYKTNFRNVSTRAGQSHWLSVASRTSSRQETRLPVSRDGQSSSAGVNKPLSKDVVSHSGVTSTKEPSDIPSKHLSTSGSSRPAFPNRSPVVLSGSTNPSKSLSVNRNAQFKDSVPKTSGSENDESDYITQNEHEKNENIAATSAPQSNASVVKEGYRPQPHENDNAKKTGSSSLPKRPVNGRFRSTSKYQIGPRFSGSLLPAQHPKPSPSIPLTESSRLPSSSSLPQFPSRVGSVNGESSRVSSSQLRHSSSRQTSNERAHGGLSLLPKQPGPTSLPASSSREPMRGTRWRNTGRQHLISQGKPNSDLKPSYEQGKNGRPNLTVSNGKIASTSGDKEKPAGRRYITGPEGAKWIVDLDKGILMNEEGRVLQDSQGRPRRVVLGEDGRTIFDLQGSPLVNPEGLALFGHGRDSRPVINPKEKFFTLGGKPIVGLDRPKPKTTTTLPTTPEPTTFPSTTETTTEETTTMEDPPTCPPGTFSRRDEKGFPLLDADGVLNCYLEEWSSGMDVEAMVTAPATTQAASPTAETTTDDFVLQTTLPPATDAPSPEPQSSLFNSAPLSDFDAAGNKRFTAPYVNYIRKDPGAPCSLTEALEYLQVDVLENLIEKDNVEKNLPPKNQPHNITVVAMEGCHSFVILDWARPLAGDMVSGYMVHSASYDDVLNNRWSSSAATGTHLAVENLKPNSRYYFKVQAKNIFGLGPISETLTYVTESDDPLLIERPPGGEPIWIPFSFKYNPNQSSCKGSQFVKRTWYRKFVGVVLCNSLRYKIFMGEGLKDTFYSIGDTYGHGEDHCQFVDSYLEGRTGPFGLSDYLPTTSGFFRAYRQEPVNFGHIGQHTPHNFVGWYECGVPIPGKW